MYSSNILQSEEIISALENLKHGDPVVVNPEHCDPCTKQFAGEKDGVQKGIPKRFCPNLSELGQDMDAENIASKLPIGTAQAWRHSLNRKNTRSKNVNDILHGKLQCLIDTKVESRTFIKLRYYPLTLRIL